LVARTALDLCGVADSDNVVCFVGEKGVKRTVAASMVAVVIGLLSSGRSFAQASPENSSREWQIWTGGGHGINGSQQGDGLWNLGLRYGMILTSPHLPGILRGQLEYAIDVVPVWVIAQKRNTAYGASVDPFAFKWIFDTPKKVKPFFQIEGGALFTNTKVPEGTSQINFTTSGGIGAHFLGKKHNFSAEVRFQHISNAGMTNPNPGINTMQVRIGFGAFRN
jgi:lipid A 3-O-deacylase